MQVLFCRLYQHIAFCYYWLMSDNRNSKSSGKTTIALSVVFALLVLVFLGILFYPKIKLKLALQKNYPLYGGMTDELQDSTLYKDLQSGRSVCFLGDSITAGLTTNGVPWYQPLTPYIKGKVSNYSTSGWQVKDLTDHITDIPVADIYIIAIGINDILFENTANASVTSEDFSNNTGRLATLISSRSDGAKIYFVSPWSFCNLDESYFIRGEEFRKAMESYCGNSDCIYIDADRVISSVLNKEGTGKYMYNEFHPNAPDGIGLFSYAVLKAAHDQGI